MRSNILSLSFSASCALFVLCLGSPAHAEVGPYPSCERDPTESDVSAAKGAYEAGEVSFQEADYERALLYWEDAFRRDCTAVKLLLNIARAYELNGNFEAAVNALQTYLDRRPDAKDRASVEKRIEKLRERVKPQSAAPPKAVTEEEPKEKDAQKEEPAPHLAPSPVEEQKTKARPVWPLVLTGVGVAGAIAGHTVAVMQQRKIEERKDVIARELGCNPDTNECVDDETRDQANDAVDSDPEVADLRARRDSANALAGLGHLAGITGGVLWWIVWTQHDTPEKKTATRPYFEPIVARGYQGFSISGRF